MLKMIDIKKIFLKKKENKKTPIIFKIYYSDI